MPLSHAEESLAAELRWLKLPTPERQYRFHPTRRWRADFAWPSHKLLLEVDGGGFVNGAHSRGMGMAKDCEKANEAVLAGWRMLRVTPAHIRDGQAIEWITRALQGNL